MTLSTFALVIGTLSYLFGLPLLFHERETMEWMKKLLKDDPLLRVIGAVVTIMCLGVLLRHWRITADAEGLIVLIAWLGLIKGLYLVWGAPEYSRIMHNFLTARHPALLGMLGIICGALFTYLAFVIQN